MKLALFHMFLHQLMKNVYPDSKPLKPLSVLMNVRRVQTLPTDCHASIEKPQKRITGFHLNHSSHPNLDLITLN